MKIIKKIKDVLVKPTEYFRNTKKERGLKDAFIYYSALSLIFSDAVLLFRNLLGKLWLEIFSFSGLALKSLQHSTDYKLSMLLIIQLLSYIIGLGTATKHTNSIHTQRHQYLYLDGCLL